MNLFNHTTESAWPGEEERRRGGGKERGEKERGGKEREGEGRRGKGEGGWKERGGGGISPHTVQQDNTHKSRTPINLEPL